ncbi:MAG: HD domain-containing protein [Sandaracinaceae bacterium]|nr:HD domain-containing protein [Sandaracinaceae bacterium]
MSARAEALAVIERDRALAELLERCRARLSDDPGHDVEHALRVAGWTLRLAPSLAPRECVAAALLHDLIDVPKNDPRRSQASSLSANEARLLLPELGFDGEAIERIAEAIEDHSYSRGASPRSPLGDALQDADRLEALGALGLMRMISTGARMGARYFHPTDPFARERELEDTRFSIDHVFTKLLRLPETMRTALGRAEAVRRAAHVRGFVEQLADELGHRLP